MVPTYLHDERTMSAVEVTMLLVPGIGATSPKPHYSNLHFGFHCPYSSSCRERHIIPVGSYASPEPSTPKPLLKGRSECISALAFLLRAFPRLALPF